jgi:lysophospholipase L1-like esterase
LSEDSQSWQNFSALGTFADDYSEKIRLIEPTMARFVKLVALNATDGDVYIAAAEINLEGRCEEPYVKILEPRTNGLQQGPDLEVSASVCLNGTDHTGWGVKFTVDGGAVQTVALPADGVIHPDTFMATFTGLALDDHLVEAVIVDDTGTEVPGTMGYDVVSTVGIGDFYVAIGDSITSGFGDDILDDNISLDGRNYSAGFAPLLNDNLTLHNGYPCTVITDAIEGEKTADGLDRLQDILARYPYAGYYLILYGTNDLESLQKADYKNLVQQMISMIRNAGKIPYLAKVPWKVGGSSQAQAFNEAIDELVAENNIAVVPPDFYTYFESNPGEMADSLHPNGTGYASMADLWYQAITGQ